MSKDNLPAPFNPNDFVYKPKEEVKGKFEMKIHNTLWVNLCAQCENIGSNPSDVVKMLMEKFLLVTGQIQPGWDKNTSPFSETVVISLEDMKNGTVDDVYKIGVNPLIYDQEREKNKKKAKQNQDEDE